jgi:hypothetical protein
MFKVRGGVSSGAVGLNRFLALDTAERKSPPFGFSELKGFGNANLAALESALGCSGHEVK